MKRFFRSAACATLLLLPSCAAFQAQVKADVQLLEAKAQAAVTKLKANLATFRSNAPQYIAQAKALGQIVCALDGYVGTSATQLQGAVVNPPPQFTSALNVAQTYATAGTAACNTIAAVQQQQPIGSPIPDLAISVFDGYQAAQVQLKKAAQIAAAPIVAATVTQ